MLFKYRTGEELHDDAFPNVCYPLLILVNNKLKECHE